MRLGAVLFACLIGASNASAQNFVALNKDAMQVGTELHYETNNNQIDRRVVTHNDGKEIWVDVFANETDTSPARTRILNSRGQVVLVLYPDGKTQTIEPTSCFRVIGTCDYTSTFTGKRSSNVRYVSKFSEPVMLVRLLNNGPHGTGGIPLGTFIFHFNSDGIMTLEGI